MAADCILYIKPLQLTVSTTFTMVFSLQYTEKNEGMNER